MSATFQLTIDCANPGLLTHFWSAALGFSIEPPPAGFDSWNAYWRRVGVSEDELDDDRDSSESLVDSSGTGPRIWFQQVPEPKIGKNRLHLDLKVSGGREVPLDERKRRVWAEVERLVDLGATELRVLSTEGIDHYAVVMQDPEGNEFCIA
ncbi:MAG: VOC family protein [Nocardioidaceae bacterium]